MTLLSKLRTYLGHDEQIPNPPVESSREAEEAYENAKRALEESNRMRMEVRQVSSSLAGLRARNHFGESIQLAMMRKGDSA